jgi:hypothetical protein
MDDQRFKRAAEGLLKAALMSADDLAAKKGEDNPFVRIKRNNERLEACTLHEFNPDPDWRKANLLTHRTVTCRNCGGEMKTNDAMAYLRGYAHGSGGDFKAITDAIWPPR